MGGNIKRHRGGGQRRQSQKGAYDDGTHAVGRRAWPEPRAESRRVTAASAPSDAAALTPAPLQAYIPPNFLI